MASLIEQMVTLLTDMTKDPASKRQETYSSNLEHFKKVVAQTVKLLSFFLVFTIYFLQLDLF